MSLVSKAKDGAKATALDLVKDGWTWLRGWLVGLFVIYVLSAFQEFYNLDHTPTSSEAALLLWQSLERYAFLFKGMGCLATL